MSLGSPPARRGRGRRPAAQVRAGILDAAAELLFAEGIGAVTFDRVADAAGSSKMTLYKWWPSTGSLAAEAYFSTSEPLLEFPDTGDIERDLRTQLRAFVDLLTGENTPNAPDGRVGRAVAGLIGAAQTDEALARAWSSTYARPRRALAVAALERARDRGQIRKDLELTIMVDQLWGACYHRLLVPDEPLDRDFADALVNNAMLGARPRG